ncbi:MAG TPA: tetratricopeptide repeat protein, partial [Gemmatimonadaceae bacterium]|nr:tetratricopeptide repeat protein [Gemmatimonadaceae bacterium]
YLERAIALDATSLPPLRSLAAIELSKGHLPVARDLLRRAFAVDSSYADVAPLLGVVLAANGEREQAMRYLADPKIDRLIENDPGGSLVVALGNAYMSSGRWDAALTVFSRALDTWPNRADFYFSAGDALIHLARPADAEPYFREAVRLDPGNVQAATEWAIAMKESGRR